MIIPLDLPEAKRRGHLGNLQDERATDSTDFH